MATQTDKQTVHVVVRGGAGNFQQEVTAGKHHLVADEPVSVGGGDAGPDPYDYLLTALGVCTSMTIGFYARRNRSASGKHYRFALALAHLCSGLRGMRNQGRHARQNRCRSGTDWAIDSRTARETDAGRGQMSRSSDAHVRDQHQIEREPLRNRIVGAGR